MGAEELGGLGEAALVEVVDGGEVGEMADVVDELGEAEAAGVGHLFGGPGGFEVIGEVGQEELDGAAGAGEGGIQADLGGSEKVEQE